MKLRFLFGALVLFVSAGVCFAATTRGAKGKLTINFSATAQRACNGPGVVYSILLSTGTNGTDYAVVRDSNTANTSSSAFIAISSTQTLPTYVVFDPPVQLANGISFNAPATMQAATLTFECGRVTNAN